MRISASENLHLAMSAVWAHRFRSGLTILGIVIGITTVVTVSSLLTGLRKGVVTFFEEFGPDNMFLYQFSGDPNNQNPPQKELRRKPVLVSYAETIKRYSPSVEDTSLALMVPPIINRIPLTARVPGFESDNVGLVGSSANSFDMQPRDLVAGRVFTAEEDNRGAKVATLGFNIAEALYPAGDALGRTFILNGTEYTVVGVFAKAKGGFFGENGLDRQVTIPFQTSRARYPQIDRVMIIIKSKSGQRAQAYEEVQAAVRKIRRTPAGFENDFNLSTPDQIIKQFDKITGLIVLISIAISGLGLLVGGIGVMNIMLVSVTERTREIGIRKAIGARANDIVLQFLMEAVALTGVGGVLGIVFAVLVTMIVGALVPSLPSEVPAWAILTGFGVSVAVGVFFGVWPALKASRLDPVEALRYE